MKLWIPALALGLALSPLLVVHPLRVSGRSMEPGLRDGSLHFARRSWICPAPRRGEVWLVEGPEGPAVKRVVGLPGERLEQREGALYREDRPLDEPYLSRYDRGDAGPWELGEGYLVAGDNRPESRDGRAWGPLPRRAFLGRLTLSQVH